MYRSKLQAVFASDPAKASWIELFGTYAPTPAPTVDPEWDNPETIDNPGSRYFNYNPRSKYGPNKWNNVREDGWYQQYWRLDADLLAVEDKVLKIYVRGEIVVRSFMSRGLG